MMSDLYSKVCGCISHSGFLTRAGYRWVDKAAQRRYLDRVDSVSAFEPSRDTMIFDDGVLDEQHRRFLNAPELV